MLEKLIEYEAVHQIQGWPDLRRRLAADRRCYGFFHPAIPDEPIIFIEAALTRGIAHKLQPLLDPDAPVADASSADCALFYSITNCQKGLRGVAFGSSLIKQVVEELKRELPKLRHFATLSPVPGFRAWLEKNPKALKDDDLAANLEDPAWPQDAQVRERLKASLVPLCARYLLREKHDKEPLDPVARFHLRNSAAAGAHQLAERPHSGGIEAVRRAERELRVPAGRSGAEPRAVHAGSRDRGFGRGRKSGVAQTPPSLISSIASMASPRYQRTKRYEPAYSGPALSTLRQRLQGNRP